MLYGHNRLKNMPCQISQKVCFERPMPRKKTKDPKQTYSIFGNSNTSPKNKQLPALKTNWKII